MKKFVTLLMTGLMMMMCTVNVFAQTYMEAGLIDVGYAVARTSKETYTISVATNGKATDGVTEITFDAAVFTAKEENVVVSENVDLYSVNVTEDSVKISYLAEKAIAKGQLMLIQLNVNEAYLDKTVSATVTCVANDANGNALKTGLNEQVPQPEPDDDVEEETETTVSTEATDSTNKKPVSTEKSTEAASSEATEVATEAVTEVATEIATEAATEVVETTEAVEKIPVEVKVDPTSEEAWKEVAEKLETITEEEELVVAFEEAAEAVVSVDFLEAVKEQAATVVLDLGNGISWVIDGSTITDAAEVNFDVTIDAGEIPEEKITEVAEGKETVKISLAHDGDFGCKPEMKFPAGKENQGKYANLYYYNPQTGELEFVCAELVAEDGYVTLKFDHASDYVVVIDEVAQVGGNTVVEQPAASSNMGMVIGIVALLAVVVVAVVVVMKKKAK